MAGRLRIPPDRAAYSASPPSSPMSPASVPMEVETIEEAWRGVQDKFAVTEAPRTYFRTQESFKRLDLHLRQAVPDVKPKQQESQREGSVERMLRMVPPGISHPRGGARSKEEDAPSRASTMQDSAMSFTSGARAGQGGVETSSAEHQRLRSRSASKQGLSTVGEAEACDTDHMPEYNDAEHSDASSIASLSSMARRGSATSHRSVPATTEGMRSQGSGGAGALKRYPSTVGKTAAHDQNRLHLSCTSRYSKMTSGEREEQARTLNYPGTPTCKWILHPAAPFRVTWDTIQAVFLLYIAMVVPYRVGFDEPAQGPLYWLELLQDVFFIVDIFLNFVTGYVEEGTGTLVMLPKPIAMHYLTNFLVVDLLACLPVDVIVRVQEGKFLCSLKVEGCPGQIHEMSLVVLLRMFRLLRLFKLIRLLNAHSIQSIIQRWQDDNNKTAMLTIRALKYLGPLLYIGHIFGCLFFYFSGEDFRTDEEQSAIDAQEMTPWLVREFCQQLNGECTKQLLDKYIASVYWAFTTMTTVGYGDIEATTRVERVFACVGMLVGGFVFSNIIASMSDSLTSMDLDVKEHEHKMEKVTTFINRIAPPKAMRREVLSYFRGQPVSPYDGMTLLEELPFQLRMKLIYHLYSSVVYLVPFLRHSAGHNKQNIPFIIAFCTRLQEQVKMKGDTVYEEDEPLPRHMYILVSGTINVVQRSTRRALAQLVSGDHFGEGWMFGEMKRRETTVCVRQATLLVACKEHVGELLSLFPHPWLILRQIHYDRLKELYNIEEPMPPVPYSKEATMETERNSQSPRLSLGEEEKEHASSAAYFKLQMAAIEDRLQAVERNGVELSAQLAEVLSILRQDDCSRSSLSSPACGDIPEKSSRSTRNPSCYNNSEFEDDGDHLEDNELEYGGMCASFPDSKSLFQTVVPKHLNADH